MILLRPLAAAAVSALLATFGLAMLLKNLCLNQFTPNFRILSDTWLGDRTFQLGTLIVPVPQLVTALLALVVVGLTYYMVRSTRFGWAIQATAMDKEAAELMGINTGRTRIQAFMLVGLISAFAGLLYDFYVAYFWPTVGGGYLLPTLASVFLGGTSVLGGTGTILGTFLGAFIIGAIEAATVAVGLTGFYTQLIYGFIIVLSVIMHTYLRKRAE